ncbi:hypothetical protein E3N88_04664 [Mikania micrantha]|uniref:non-specific serine/threonine protein kinase n=1 Tax=Mikania micrantha TaxID=192012 RepID=A0A5N6PWX1_9ASTR|nr:hypothetical protein E3N88_04664 [Mikania micrantha]
MSPLLLLLHHLPFFFFTAIPAAAQSYNQYGTNCPSYMWDTVNISYPFWKMSNTENNTQFCGYQGFGINSTENGGQNISLIAFGGDSYYIRSIDYNSRSIDLAIYDVSSVFPGPPNSCPRVRHNISLGNLPLQFSTSMVNLSFHFNCDGSSSFAIEIPCLFGSERNAYVNVMNVTTEEDWGDHSCADKVVTTVFPQPDLITNISAVTYGTLLQGGFELQWGRMDDCERCEDSNGRCGNHITTGFRCFCPDGTVRNNHCKGTFLFLPCKWQDKSDIETGSPSSNCVASLKHKTEDDKNVEAFVTQYGALNMKRYQYNEIKKMTNSFQVKLGQGGFGQVFKGKLSDGRLVAVKLLNTSKANGQEFINEVASIGRTSHVNIVTLLGFCFDFKKRALVYEYMPNGSLEKFIHSHVHMGTSEQLGATKLYEIALGIAHGLDYLHRGCNTRILHLDIKPHNILLDEDFCPKIADFGLAKLYSRKESIVSMLEARGTIGYIAPEIYNQNFGGVSHKSDVYSYGMLLLEMVGGRKNIDAGVGFGQTSEIYFPDWIYKRLHKDGFVLDSITTTEEDVYARKMTIVGLWCIQFAPNQRPAINEVIEMLEGSIQALEVPPKPFFSSPPRSPVIICSTSESMIELA